MTTELSNMQITDRFNRSSFVEVVRAKADSSGFKKVRKTKLKGQHTDITFKEFCVKGEKRYRRQLTRRVGLNKSSC